MIGELSDARMMLNPKERLAQIFLRKRNRAIRIPDFSEIASRTKLDLWTSSPAFGILKETLQNWFPRT